MPTPKKKTKVDAAAAAEAAARRAVIDEYGSLDAELAPAKQKIKRQEELAKVIRGWHVNSAPALSVIERGDRFHVVVGMCGDQAIIAPASALYEALGQEKFLSIAKTTLTALEGEATAAQLAQLTKKERIGPRSLKAVPAINA